MANNEIMIDMEHYKRELQRIEVSKSDKAKLKRLLSVKGVTRHRGGLGSNFLSTSQRCAGGRTMQPFRIEQNDLICKDTISRAPFPALV